MQWFKTMAKTEALIVPYRGIGPALQDTVAGHVKTMMVGVGVADEMINAGRVHPLAVTNAKRLRSAPSVPTVAEQGWPDYEFVTWYGVVAPKDTPKEIVERLNREINAALQDADVSARIAQAGGEIVGGPPETLMETYRRDVTKYNTIFQVTGIKLD
jgi:tripartite-type tricarboxylate transporter receptor subunit TctC